MTLLSHFGKVKQNIAILAVSNLIIGLIEFIFNMYLTRILGAEGLGILSLISPINALFLSFMTEGIVVTMSKISARQQHFQDYAAMNATIKIVTAFSFLWALVLVGVVWLSAGTIADSFLGDPSYKYPILATCPLMVLMSISNIVKGHFLGLAKIKIPSIINISEKILRFPILYLLIRFFFNQTGLHPVTLVYLCYAIGEMQSVLFLFIYYKRTKPDVPPLRINKKVAMEMLKPLIKGASPICFTQCLLEFANAFSSIIVKSRLLSIGLTASESLSLLGMYKGMVFPLMNYPAILVGAACSIVVPKISTLMATGKSQYADRLIRRSMILALAIGLLTCAVLWVWSDQMGMFFYKQEGLGKMIRLAGLCAPLLYVTATTTYLLISIGKEALSLRNSMFQQLLLLIGLILFTGIPALNIYGYILAIAISNGILLIRNLHSLNLHQSAHSSS